LSISFLPELDVYIAFNPNASGATMNTAYAQALPSTPGSSNGYWTCVTQYLTDLATHEGRQHFIDRIEAGTLQATFNGRDGFFWNGTVNGTGQTISPRFPIAATFTISVTTYPLFFGVIDSAKETILDQLNSDVVINATDMLKQLSLRTLESPAFWSNYTTSASVANYYSATTTQTAVITAATGNGTTITYTGFNNFTVGDTVTIAGLTIFSGASLNLVNVTVATASSNQFTVTNSTVGISNGGGSGYRSRMLDLVGGNNALIVGTASFPASGAIIYVNSGCLDLANGGAAGTAFLKLPVFSANHGALDFWILGQGLANSILVTGLQTSISSTGYPMNFTVGHTGLLQVSVPTFSGTVVSGSTQVNDGFWHHVGICSDSSGVLQMYCDGVFTSLSAIATCSGWNSATNVEIGTLLLGGTAMYIDEVCVSNTSGLSGLEGELKNRYIAGTLLQLPIKTTSAGVSSGDRIAELLCLGGFGTVSGGAVVLDANLYYINNGSAWSGYSSSNGLVNVQPWYWDAPVFSSTILDLIYEICETDVGGFYQKGDGTFAYHNQKFHGVWQWDTLTNATSTSTTMTFTATNTLTPGQTVAIVGCYPTGYNGVYTVTTASGSGFTVTNNRNPGAGVTFGMAGGWLPTSYSPSGDHTWSDDASTNYAYEGSSFDAPRDEADVWTSVVVTPQAGVDQIFENVYAQGIYGFNNLIKSGTVHDTLSHALSTACYLGVLFRSPLQRVQTVTFLAQTANGANNGAIVNCQLDQVVSMARTPPNASAAGSINRNMVIEARDISYTAATGLLTATYTLDPYSIRG